MSLRIWDSRTPTSSTPKPASAPQSTGSFERRGLSQAEVMTAPEINQPKVSALLHYKLEGFSVEALMRFLVAIGHDVEIVVKAKPRSRSARIAVCAA